MNEHYPFDLPSMQKLGEQLLECKDTWETTTVLANACGMRVAKHLDRLLCQLLAEERRYAIREYEERTPG